MASGLQSFENKRHIHFFEKCLEVLPSRYASLDTTRMTIAFFALSGLDMLDAMASVGNYREEIIDWIYSLQIVPNEDETNLDICGFRGSSTIKSDSTEDNKYDISHIAMTYTALLGLIIMEDDLSGVNKKGIISGLKKLQLPDGSFSPTIDGSENDMRFVYCACVISYIMDDWTGIDTEKALTFIRNSLSYEGAFGQGPGLEAHGGSTFCAIASLILMGSLNDVLTQSQVDHVIRWCLFRQQSGFQGRPNKPVDTCYSFWVGATLKLLGAFEMSSFQANKAFLMETQDNGFGGFSKSPDSSPDVLHTYFGICGLSLMGEEGVRPMHAALNISEKSAKRLESVQRQWHNGINQNTNNSNSVVSTEKCNGNNLLSDTMMNTWVKGDPGYSSSMTSTVPKLQIDQHITFLKSALKCLHHPHAPLDTSRLSSIHFALTGLDLLHALSSLSIEEKHLITDWIFSSQILSSGGTSLMMCAPSKSQPDTNNHIDSSHIELTYTAICALLTLENSLTTLNRDAVINHLRDLQQPNGGFSSSRSSSLTDLKCVYCAICISYLLQDFSALNIPKLVQYIKSCMTKEGVFSLTPGTSSDEGATFWATSSLKLLDNLHTSLSSSDLEKIGKWCKQQEQHNIAQGKNIKCNSKSAIRFWVDTTLRNTGKLHSIDYDHWTEFTLKSQHHDLGGFTTSPDQLPDTKETYYSLCMLTSNSFPGINSMNPNLGISQTALDHTNKLWRISGGQTAI